MTNTLISSLVPSEDAFSLLPPVGDMAAEGPWWRQGTVRETYAYLSAETMDLSNSANLVVITPL